MRRSSTNGFDSSRRFHNTQFIDEDNYGEVKGLIDKAGFPSEAKVGENGVLSTWLIVQHASHDPEFQYKVLQMIESRVAGIELTGEQYALLHDRVSILYFHRKQKYGTQMYPGSSPAIPLPIEDENSVDERRSALGMMPIADYLCVSSAIHDRKSR